MLEAFSCVDIFWITTVLETRKIARKLATLWFNLLILLVHFHPVESVRMAEFEVQVQNEDVWYLVSCTIHSWEIQLVPLHKTKHRAMFGAIAE